MSRTLTALPADRLMAVVTGILGTPWTPPPSPEWPLVFTHEDTARELSFHPEPKNRRIVFHVGPAGADNAFGRRRCAKYTPDITGHDSIGTWLAGGDLDADKASRIRALAEQTEQSATRVDELRGPVLTRTAGRI
ncbi:hypothetical protein GL263_14695 [Streptomyces durbertensis]|uniref:Uncharacterized protein n=1 Tax=Streptomyces durbertensis TaxID=2448886 RepID=A0ABR6EHK6_9ACTN|nr:hypothetical protein [Streptomyces durbertensis]MBB1244805.1 hypothetical protein [Streptomyces durbertensis]